MGSTDFFGRGAGGEEAGTRVLVGSVETPFDEASGAAEGRVDGEAARGSAGGKRGELEAEAVGVGSGGSGRNVEVRGGGVPCAKTAKRIPIGTSIEAGSHQRRGHRRCMMFRHSSKLSEGGDGAG